MLVDQLPKAKAELAKEKTVPKSLIEAAARLIYPIVKGDVNYEKLHWDLRRKKIEEAKAAKPVWPLEMG
jgi:hypothetical protein